MQVSEAPVLFVTFNRPDTTKVVFESIRKAKPKKLYISSDGPREKKYEDDWRKISEIRELVEKVDWECIVETRFLSENLGCGLGVSGAINWAFEKEDKLIIVEDDCVPSQSFFSFCNELLNRYADDERIMHISGTRWNEEFPINDCDFFYTRYAHIWGWATWKRAWQQYDFWMKDYPLFKEKKILNTIVGDYPPLLRNWNALFNSIYDLPQKHTWDYQWQYCIFKNNGLSINTVHNQVTNIGAQGTHSNEEGYFHNRERHELNEELRAPAFMFPEYGWEMHHARNFFMGGRKGLKILYDHLAYKIPFLRKKIYS